MRSESEIAGLMLGVNDAAAAFERRWTLGALRRLDAELHAKLLRQKDRYSQALVTGTLADARKHAEGMERGWNAAVTAMEGAQAPEDAYWVGQAKNGQKIAITQQRTAMGRVQEVHGNNVAVFTPDELADLVVGFELVKQAKELFPDAEIINVYPGEPAKDDAA